MTYVLGVDLGTTATAAVARQADGTAEPLELDDGTTMPSVIAVGADGELVVGTAAARRARTEPHQVAREFKRRFGDTTPIVLGGTPYGADRLMAALLAQVLAAAIRRFGEPPAAVALSHPASWGPYKLELLVEVARQAGVPDAMLVPEPVAAALEHAAASDDPNDLVCVYDLGGGTFDVAAVRRTDHGYEVVGTPDGLERFGGIDVDHAVLGIALGEAGLSGEDVDPSDPALAARLADECRAAKEALSSDTETTVELHGTAGGGPVRITRARLESALAPRLADTINALRRTIESAGCSLDDVDAILVVGGASRMPAVADAVRRATGVAIVTDAHPKLVVARGAARAAAGVTASATDAERAEGADTTPAAQPVVVGRQGGVLPGSPARRPSTRPRQLLLGIAGIVAAAAASAGWLVLRDRDETTSTSRPRTASTTTVSTGSGTTTTSATASSEVTTSLAPAPTPAGGTSGSGIPGRTSPTTPTATAPPTTTDPTVPVVRSVSAPASVTCGAGSSGGEISVSWSASNAASVQVAVDAAAQLWESGLPLVGMVRIPYNCPSESPSKRIYVTAIANSGITTTKSVVVSIASG